MRCGSRWPSLLPANNMDKREAVEWSERLPEPVWWDHMTGDAKHHKREKV